MKKYLHKLPLISVIVTCYNNKSTIEKSLQSVYVQKGGFGLELVVVDDCSTDASYQHLASLQNTYEFKLAKTAKNGGPSVARNKGLSLVKGKYVNFLDGDDELIEGKLQTQLSVLENYADRRVVYSDCILREGAKDTRLCTLWPVKSGQIYTHLLSRNCIALHAALIETALAKKYQFDESLRTSEDYDFWLRIARDSHSFYFINKPYAVYNYFPTRLSKPSEKVYLTTVELLKKQKVENAQEQASINEHLAGLYTELAKQFLSKHKANQAAQYLNEVAKYKPLSKFLQLTRWALEKNDLLGFSIYHLGMKYLSIRKTVTNT